MPNKSLMDCPFWTEYIMFTSYHVHLLARIPLWPLSTEPEADSKVSASASESPAAPGAGGGSVEEGSCLPGLPRVDEVRQALDKLVVAEQGSTVGYSRTGSGTGPTATSATPGRRSSSEAPATCSATTGVGPTSGHWGSVYEGKTITDASDLSLDHMVPLVNAWRSGAKGWERDKRTGIRRRPHPPTTAGRVRGHQASVRSQVGIEIRVHLHSLPSQRRTGSGDQVWFKASTCVSMTLRDCRWRPRLSRRPPGFLDELAQR